MRLHFDKEVDALYLRLDESSPVLESEEVHPGIVLDFDAQDRVVGIEILGVRQRLPKADLQQIQLDLG